MGQITSQEELRTAIANLEIKKQVQQIELKAELQQAKMALQPVNLVRNTFSQFAEIPEVRKTLISTVVGFGLGYVAKKAQAIMSEESLDNMVNTMVHTQVSKLENKSPESFATKAITFFRKNLRKDSPLYPFLGVKQHQI